MEQLQHDVTARWQFYSQLAGVKRAGNGGNGSRGEAVKIEKETD
jgi:hypothetical protein